MTTLITGMVLFFGIHLLASTPVRATLARALGAKPYKGVFSLISIVGLGLMIWGFGLSRYGPDAARIVFNPPVWGPLVTPFLVFAGLVILGAGHGKSHIRKIVRQPMSVGVALWAFGHLFSNGNLNEVLLFGGFLVYAIYDIVISTAKGKVADFEPTFKSDIKAVVIGAVVFAVIMHFHFNLFGVSVT